jgi:hypothetical protein
MKADQTVGEACFSFLKERGWSAEETPGNYHQLVPVALWKAKTSTEPPALGSLVSAGPPNQI